MISTSQKALDNTMAGGLPLEKENQFASQEIVRAQFKEVLRLKFSVGLGFAADRPQLLDWPRHRT
jgi:hypothetical protein